MRKPIIVGNWKMNKTIAEAVEFIKAVDPVCHDGATVSYTHLDVYKRQAVWFPMAVL